MWKPCLLQLYATFQQLPTASPTSGLLLPRIFVLERLCTQYEGNNCHGWRACCLISCASERLNNLVEAHCYGIGRTGQIFEQSRSSEETDRNVDVSTAKVFVSTMLLTKTFAVETSTFLSVSSLLRDCSKICPVRKTCSLGLRD